MWWKLAVEAGDVEAGGLVVEAGDTAKILCVCVLLFDSSCAPMISYSYVWPGSSPAAPPKFDKAVRGGKGTGEPYYVGQEKPVALAAG